MIVPSLARPVSQKNPTSVMPPPVQRRCAGRIARGSPAADGVVTRRPLRRRTRFTLSARGRDGYRSGSPTRPRLPLRKPVRRWPTGLAGVTGAAGGGVGGGPDGMGGAGGGAGSRGRRDGRGGAATGRSGSRRGVRRLGAGGESGRAGGAWVAPDAVPIGVMVCIGGIGVWAASLSPTSLSRAGIGHLLLRCSRTGSAVLGTLGVEGVDVPDNGVDGAPTRGADGAREFSDSGSGRPRCSGHRGGAGGCQGDAAAASRAEGGGPGWGDRWIGQVGGDGVLRPALPSSGRRPSLRWW